MQIYIIIETSLLLREYSTPSLEKNEPTLISEEYVCIVKAGYSDRIEELKKNVVKFKKEAVDEINFHLVSESANFDNTILVYDLKEYGNSSILEQLQISHESVETIIPTHFDPLETTKEKRTFSIHRNKILNTGESEYGIHFGVFNYDFTPQGFFELRLNFSIE